MCSCFLFKNGIFCNNDIFTLLFEFGFIIMILYYNLFFNRPFGQITLERPRSVNLILDSFLTNKITKDELLKHLKSTIVEIKESKCIICKEIKETIRICNFKDHCYCLDDFCMWYKDNDNNCLLCKKKFKLPS